MWTKMCTMFWEYKILFTFKTIVDLNKKTAGELREESIIKKKHKLNQSIQYLIWFN
jgi:hypothetical protein